MLTQKWSPPTKLETVFPWAPWMSNRHVVYVKRPLWTFYIGLFSFLKVSIHCNLALRATVSNRNVSTWAVIVIFAVGIYIWDTSQLIASPPLHWYKFLSPTSICPLRKSFTDIYTFSVFIVFAFSRPRVRASLCHSAALWCRTGSAKQLQTKLWKLYCRPLQHKTVPSGASEARKSDYIYIWLRVAANTFYFVRQCYNPGWFYFIAVRFLKAKKCVRLER